MKIVILSRKPKLYSTRRLKEAGEKRGHEVVVINYLRCCMNIAAHHPIIVYQGKPLEHVSAVIPRIGESQTFYGTAVVRQFEMMGVFCANASQPIARARDKLRCLQLLARDGIGLPVTALANSPKDVQGVIDVVGAEPYVLKLVEGTKGMGAVLAQTRKAAASVIEAFSGVQANILVQEFVKESSGAEYRAFVIGKKIVASVRREGAPGSLGMGVKRRRPKTEPVKLKPAERGAVLSAVKIMGLGIAAVDFLRSDRGPVILGVIASPGLEDIEQAGKLDLAAGMIEYVEVETAKRAAKASSTPISIPNDAL